MQGVSDCLQLAVDDRASFRHRYRDFAFERDSLDEDADPAAELFNGPIGVDVPGIGAHLWARRYIARPFNFYVFPNSCIEDTGTLLFQVTRQNPSNPRTGKLD